MNTITIFFSNTQKTIGSLFESKITTDKVNMDLHFEPAYTMTFDKSTLKIIKTELSALSKFNENFYVGVDDGFAFIYIRNNQTEMNVEYKRWLFIVNDSNISAHYSIDFFMTILKNLKSKEPNITILKNKLMAIQDNDNTYVLAHKEID
jgi:hypothetical protein